MNSSVLLTVVANYAPDTKANVLVDYFGNFLLKTKQEVCICLVGSDNKNLETSFVANKNTKDLLAKGQITFADTTGQALEIAQGTYILPFQFTTDINLTLLYSWFAAEKKQENEVYMCTGEHEKSTLKPSFQNKISGFFTRFFTPLPVADSTGVAIYPLGLVKEIGDTDTILNSTECLYKAALKGYSIIPAPVFVKEKAVIKSGLSFFALWMLAIRMRIFWFIVTPLKEIKTSELSFADAKHPIYRLAYAALLIFMLVFMPIKSFDFGITWDEKLHNKYGYDMLKYFQTSGADTTCFTSHPHFPYYGEHFNLYSAAINTYFPVLEEFETRHFLNSLYGFLAMLFASLCARLIGNWRTGFIALVFLFLNPNLLGHSMNNPTDIPFTTGCIMATYYLIRLLKSMPEARFRDAFFLACGIGIAIGSRIGGLVLYGYLGLFLGISWLAYSYRTGIANGFKQIKTYVIYGGLAGVLGYFMGIMFWPYGQYRPFTNPFIALKTSTSPTFFTFNHELFDGVRGYMKYVPWYYIPKFMVINTPLFSVIGFGLAMAGFLWVIKKYQWQYILLLIFTMVFPVMYAEYKEMYYYNGWRHYLFIYPAFIIISAIGWDMLVGLFSNKMVKIGIAAVMLALVGKSTFWMVQNHPHEYVYFNELVGGIEGAYGNYETDYYCNTLRPATEWLIENEPRVKAGKKLVVGTNNEPLSSQYYFDKVSDSVSVAWLREYEKNKTNWDYALITTRTMSKTQLTNGSFPPKGTIHVIKAGDAPLVAIVKRENDFMPRAYRYYAKAQYDSAAYMYSRYIEYNPLEEEAYRQLGMCYVFTGKYDDARKAFDKALQLYPENYIALYGIGAIFMQQGQYDTAIEWFKKSVGQKVNYNDAYFNMGRAYIAKKMYEEGIQCYQKIMDMTGQDPNVLNEMGVAYLMYADNNKMMQKDLLQRGINCLQLSLQMKPDNPGNYQNLGIAYMRLGDKATADACFQKARQLGGM